MKFWIITDTHLGHDKMVDFCGRPSDFSNRILRNISLVVRHNDVLIHLGDICIGNDAKWTAAIRSSCNGRMWLVRGNHDRKTTSWYLDHGWDWCANSMTLDMFGRSLLFTHEPVDDPGGNLNIHGHLHNTGHHDTPGGSSSRLIFIEHHYCPVGLDKIVMSS